MNDNHKDTTGKGQLLGGCILIAILAFMSASPTKPTDTKPHSPPASAADLAKLDKYLGCLKWVGEGDNRHWLGGLKPSEFCDKQEQGK